MSLAGGKGLAVYALSHGAAGLPHYAEAAITPVKGEGQKDYR
jgi:hypothetical protein